MEITMVMASLITGVQDKTAFPEKKKTKIKKDVLNKNIIKLLLLMTWKALK